MMYTGAVREHWRSALRQKLSKNRAEERKVMEEKRKFYNEEVGGETDEEEAELTGTSGCQYSLMSARRLKVYSE